MEFLEMYTGGMSITEVSEEAGIAKSTIRFRLKKIGALRSRHDGVLIARDKGKLGGGNRGKRRVFTKKWKENISKAKKGNGKGYSLKPNGYVELTMGANKGRGQHVVIMEEKIGRKLLSNECVHHVNSVRNDNRVENLELMTRAKHARHHASESNANRARNSRGQYE